MFKFSIILTTFLTFLTTSHECEGIIHIGKNHRKNCHFLPKFPNLKTPNLKLAPKISVVERSDLYAVRLIEYYQHILYMNVVGYFIDIRHSVVFQFNSHAKNWDGVFDCTRVYPEYWNQIIGVFNYLGAWYRFCS